jgi:hypothetical protein
LKQKLKLAGITVDPTIQPRAKGLDQSHVDDLAQAYRDKKAINCPTVWKIGDVYKLSQGFHRVQAAHEAGLKELEFHVMVGTDLDCAIDALCANQEHGLKRTNEDKRRAVDRILELCPNWTNTRIEAAAGVSDWLVNERRSLVQVPDSGTSEPQKRVGKDGKTYTVPPKKAKSDTPKAAELPVASPGAKRLRGIPGFPPKLADALESHKIVTLLDLDQWQSELPNGQANTPRNLLLAIDNGHKLDLDEGDIDKAHDAIVDWLWIDSAKPKPQADEPATTEASDDETGEDTDVEASTPTAQKVPEDEPLESKMNKVAKAIDQLTIQIETWKDDPLSYCIPFQSILGDLRKARSDIHATRPVYTCPYCGGKKKYKGKDCTGCKAVGMVCKHVYNAGRKAMG